MKVKVKKISKNIGSYKTNLDQINFMPIKPSEGKPLILCDKNDPSTGIFTSNVEKISFDGNIYTVKTLNSTYEITLVLDTQSATEMDKVH